MDPTQFFTAARLVIVAGKGGVGKTTVTAALAQAAADLGRTVLCVEIEPDGCLARCFDRPASTYEGQVLYSGTHGHITGRAVTAHDALTEYLDSRGLARLARRLLSSNAGDVAATAAPGIEDILVLGKIKALERDDPHQLILVDAPAAGHAISFLRAASALTATVTSGAIRDQATEVMEMLADPARCQVVLVTIAEETPVNEVIETAFALEDQLGLSLGPLVVNSWVRDCPDNASLVDVPVEMAQAARQAAEFARRRHHLAVEQLARLDDRLPIERLRLPYLYTGTVGPAEIAILARSIADQLADRP